MGNGESGNSGRFPFDDLFKRPPVNRVPLNQDDFPPDGQEFLSPASISISSPVFDVFSPDFGNHVADAFVSYMGNRGPKEIKAGIPVQTAGYFTMDYRYAGRQDFWDYHGPMKLGISLTFMDTPLGKNLDKRLEEAIREAFLNGGYEETSETQFPYVDTLSTLSMRVSTKVLDFDVPPLYVPTSAGNGGRMSPQDFHKAVMAASPKAYVYWRLS